MAGGKYTAALREQIEANAPGMLSKSAKQKYVDQQLNYFVQNAKAAHPDWTDDQLDDSFNGAPLTVTEKAGGPTEVLGAIPIVGGAMEKTATKNDGTTTTVIGGGPGGGPGGYTMDRSAWDPVASAGYGGPYVSDATKAAQARQAAAYTARRRSADLQAQLDQLQQSKTTTTTIQTPGGPQQITIPVNDPRIDEQIATLSAQLKEAEANNPALDKEMADAKSEYDASVRRDAGEADTRRLASEADKAAGRTGPELKDTRIDFSGATEDEQRQLQARDLQQKQAAALMSGASGAGQEALVGRLNRDLSGEAPSLAELQLLEGRDKAIQNSLSIANSARGNNAGVSALEALRANQAMMQDTGRSAAMLRAQEYAQARGELGTVLGQQRTAGIQEQNVAATELGQGRSQDLTQLANKYNNAVQQGLLTDQDARARLDAELRQRGMNDDQVRFYVGEYQKAQTQRQNLGIDREKAAMDYATGNKQAATAQYQAETGRQSTNQQQSQYDTNNRRSDESSLIQGGATGWQAYKDSQAGKPGGGPGGTTPTSTGYTQAETDKIAEGSSNMMGPD